jgi:hypothetical protein
MAQKALTDYMMDWLSDLEGKAARVHPVSGLPIGTLATQPSIAATATAAIQTFSQPAKGVRLCLLDGSTADPDLYVLVAFDPPNTTILADWLDETLVGPRFRVLANQVLELNFLDINGVQTTVDSMGYDWPTATAGSSLSVEVVV